MNFRKDKCILCRLVLELSREYWCLNTISYVYIPCIVIVVVNGDSSVVIREEARDRVCPFDNYYGVLVVEVFLEVFRHETGVRETIEVVVNELFIARKSVLFRNSETGACNRLFDAEAFGETADKGGFTGADICDELDDCRWANLFGEGLAKI